MAPKASKKQDELQQKSPAEFFADNKNIAGFDNVRACRRVCAAAFVAAPCSLQRTRAAGLVQKKACAAGARAGADAAAAARETP